MKRYKGEVHYGFKLLHKVLYTAKVDDNQIREVNFDISPELNKEAWGPLEEIVREDVGRQMRWEQQKNQP